MNTKAPPSPLTNAILAGLHHMIVIAAFAAEQKLLPVKAI